METHFVPNNIRDWLACAAFIMWAGLLAMKWADRIRGPKSQPGNESLGQTAEQMIRDHKETRSRVIALETWRNSLSQKMEGDKQEILNAGERRQETLREEIEALRERNDDRFDEVILAIGRLQGAQGK